MAVKTRGRRRAEGGRRAAAMRSPAIRDAILFGQVHLLLGRRRDELSPEDLSLCLALAERDKSGKRLHEDYMPVIRSLIEKYGLTHPDGATIPIASPPATGDGRKAREAMTPAQAGFIHDTPEPPAIMRRQPPRPSRRAPSPATDLVPAALPTAHCSPPTAPAGPLNGAERRELASAEKTVERGKAAFVEVGNALAKIRDGRLYRATHDTWDAYCRERWGWGRQEAADKIRAAETYRLVSPISDRLHLPAPTAEDHLKALAPVRDPDDVKAIYEAVCRRSRKDHVPITGTLLREERERYLTPADEFLEKGVRVQGSGAAKRAEAGEPDAEELFAKMLRAAVGQLETIARSYPDRAAEILAHLADLLGRLKKAVAPRGESTEAAAANGVAAGGVRANGAENAGRKDSPRRKAAKPQRTPR